MEYKARVAGHDQAFETPRERADDNGIPASAIHVIRELRRAFHALDVRLDAALAPVHLTYAQHEILLILYDEPKRYAAELASRLNVRRQSVHRVVGTLEREGLVEKLEIDAGVRGIMLTHRGLDRLWDAQSPLHAFLSVLDAVGPRTRTRLSEDLRSLCSVVVPPTRPWWWD